MCSQAQSKSKKKEKKEQKELKAQKKVDMKDEELRQQVRRTLWQAAMAGKLENIFPEVLHSRAKTERTASDASDVAAEATSVRQEDKTDLACERGSAPGSSSASTVDTANSEHTDCDIDQLRRQARQTFCEAIFSGKLDQVLGQATGKSTMPTAESSDGAAAAGDMADIRTKVRATLEQASCNGRLKEVLTRHQRLSQNRQDRQSPKAEDTRDLDQLLLEIGETETSKPPKNKKKSKKSSNSPQGKACDKPVLSTAQSEGPQEAETKDVVSAITDDQQAIARQNDVSLEQLAAPAPAMEPIARKAPVAPAPVIEPIARLHQAERRFAQDVTSAKAQAGATSCAKGSSRRRALPPPPCGLPPPPPQTDVTDAASSGGGMRNDLPSQPAAGSQSPPGHLRSIQIWPDTPESTPPNSPRKGWEEEQEEQGEVLVPIPISLLAEVRRLLIAGTQPDAVAAPPIAFGEVTVA